MAPNPGCSPRGRLAAACAEPGPAGQNLHTLRVRATAYRLRATGYRLPATSASSSSWSSIAPLPAGGSPSSRPCLVSVPRRRRNGRRSHEPSLGRTGVRPNRPRGILGRFQRSGAGEADFSEFGNLCKVSAWFRTAACQVTVLFFAPRGRSGFSRGAQAPGKQAIRKTAPAGRQEVRNAPSVALR